MAAERAGRKRKAVDVKDEKDKKDTVAATAIGSGVIRLKQHVATLVLAANNMANAAVFRDTISVDTACKRLKSVATMLESSLRGDDTETDNDDDKDNIDEDNIDVVFYVTAKGQSKSLGWCVYWRCTLKTTSIERWLKFQIELNDECDSEEENNEWFDACGYLPLGEFRDVNWNGHKSAPKGTLHVLEVKEPCSLEDFKENIRWGKEDAPKTGAVDDFNERSMYDFFTTKPKRSDPVAVKKPKKK